MATLDIYSHKLTGCKDLESHSVIFLELISLSIVEAHDVETEITKLRLSAAEL